MANHINCVEQGDQPPAVMSAQAGTARIFLVGSDGCIVSDELLTKIGTSAKIAPVVGTAQD